MDQPMIFISHAGMERGKAVSVAALLEAAGIPTILDVHDLTVGGSFVAFMEHALRDADYCLLLWSRAAGSRPFVEAEWQAAFAKDVASRRIFLLVGRLEDYPPPLLLRSRLYIDLFPEIEPGVNQLITLWRRDAHAASESGKDVVPPQDPNRALVGSSDGVEVYVTSELFDCILPLRVDLDLPAWLLLNGVIERLGLPQRLAVNDSLGINLFYRLLFRDRPVERERTLRAQGALAGAVLNLEVSVEDFARIPPASVSEVGHRRQFREAPQDYKRRLTRKLVELGLRHP